MQKIMESEALVDITIGKVSVIGTAITEFPESTRDGPHNTDREGSMSTHSIRLAEDIAG
jgi:hypothetical protein